MAAAALVVISVVGSTSASASGDPTVNGYILKNPVTGWIAAPSSISQTVATTVASDLLSNMNQKVTVAADGWIPASEPVSGELLIVLVRFPGSTVPATPTTGELVSDICTGAGATPGLPSPLSAVSDSDTESCQTGSQGAITAVGWEKGNVAAFVYGAGLTSNLVDGIAQQQSAQIPAAGITSGSSFPYLLLGGAVVVAVVVAIVLGRRRSMRSTPAFAGVPPPPAVVPRYAGGLDSELAASRAATEPWAVKVAVRPGAYGGTQSFPGPGAVAYPGPAVEGPPASEPARLTEVAWYPVDGDPHRQRYWDGEDWTEQLRWDGSTWVEES
jgi:hypothetical protein